VFGGQAPWGSRGQNGLCIEVVSSKIDQLTDNSACKEGRSIRLGCHASPNRDDNSEIEQVSTTEGESFNVGLVIAIGAGPQVGDPRATVL
jgi:hypothetical protein